MLTENARPYNAFQRIHGIKNDFLKYYAFDFNNICIITTALFRLQPYRLWISVQS